MKFVLISLLSLLAFGAGGYFYAAQKTDWSGEGVVFEKALNEVILQANGGADAEVVGKLSKCMAGKIVEHLASPDTACCLPAPKNTGDALKVVESCVGPVAGLYFQACLLGTE